MSPMSDQVEGYVSRGDRRGLSVTGQLEVDTAEPVELPGNPSFAEVVNRHSTDELWVCMDPADEAEVEGSNSTCVLPMSAVSVHFLEWDEDGNGVVSLISSGTPKYVVQELS